MNYVRISLLLTTMLVSATAFAQAELTPLNVTALSDAEQDAAEAVLIAHLEAIANQDVAALKATMAEDFKAYTLWTEEPDSKEAEVASWTRNFEAWENINMDMVVTSLQMNPPAEAEDGEPWTMVMAFGEVGWDDIEAGVDGVTMMLRVDAEVQDGKLVAMWTFWDRMVAQQQYEAAAEGEEE